MVYIEIMTCEGESEISPQPLYLYNDKIVGNRNQVAADFRQWGLQLVLWLPSANRIFPVDLLLHSCDLYQKERTSDDSDLIAVL